MPIKRINLLQYVEKDDDNLVGKFLTNLPLLLVMYYLLYKIQSHCKQIESGNRT